MSRYTTALRWLSYAVIAISLVILIRSLPIGDGVAAMRIWIEGLGVWGPLVFGVIYVVAVITMVPASLLTLAGGAAFGLLVGTITVSIASNLGAALALLIGRYLARGKVEQIARQRPHFAAIDRAISEGGWKIVAMLRLSPAVPFNVQNYLYGLTSIGFWTCVLTSWLAMLPGTFLYVYLGHAAGSITGAGREKTPAEWTLLGVGLLATIAVTVYITRLAQQQLRQKTAIGESEREPDTLTSATLDEPAADRSTSHASWKTIVPAVVAVLLAGLAGAVLTNPTALAQTLRSLLPLGPPVVTMTEQYPSQGGGATFDHSQFDALLRQVVDTDGWVNYQALADDPQPLDEYLRSLAEAPFDALDRDEKLALLLNAYNACTLKLILDHWPVQSIKDIPARDRWAAPRWVIGNNTWSLEQIEHEQIRPNFKEPRIHFALVCAAVGCPPLAQEAYTAGRLESQLQRQAEFVHTHSTWCRPEPEQGQLHLTPLYQWYRGDFEQAADSIVDFVARFNPTVRDRLDEGQTWDVRFLLYDWSINSQANRQPR